jgi:hypothetical protein
MNKPILAIYKVPIIISLVMAIIMLATSALRQPFGIAQVFLGALLGMFILDLEYYLNAFVLDTKTDFSKTLVGFINHKDWANAVLHVHYHKDDSKENSLNSSLFQMVLAAMSVFVVFSSVQFFAKSLILSVFAQSIYVLFEYYYKDRTDDWFWAMNVKPSKQGVRIYIFVLLLILSYCLYIF